LNVPVALEQNSETGEDVSRQSGEEPTRQWLLQELRRVMEIALDRVTNSKTAAEDRIKWSRIMIAAGGACNSVLRDVEVDELKREITELKTLLAERLEEEEDDEDRGAQTGDPEPKQEDP
jgi:hypothetical protein